MLATSPPWPVRSGNTIRLDVLVGALTSLGPVDVVAMTDTGEAPASPPPGVEAFVVVDRPAARRARLAWALRRSLPLELAGRDYADVRRARQGLGPHDLVVHSQVESVVAFGPTPGTPSILDLVDAEDRKAMARASWARRDGPGRARAAAAQARRNAAVWRRAQRRAASVVDVVVACSPTDAAAAGRPDALVVPNGYHEPDAPAGRRRPNVPPTLLLAGLLTYPPNAVGAAWMVQEVLPHVHRRLPGVRLRLVGRADDRVRSLHAPPGVVVTGFVDDMGGELAGADAVVVPVPWGGGTRIKVLEGLAHGIPVVTTGAGAEGLDVRHGREVLIADDARAFAAACVAALTDVGLRARLTAAGSATFADRYRWADVSGRFRELAASLVEAAAPSPSASR